MRDGLGWAREVRQYLLPGFLQRRREDALFIFCQGRTLTAVGKIMAACLLSSLPPIMLFLCTMKLLIHGLSSGAVKG